jgi:hypothetical protein
MPRIQLGQDPILPVPIAGSLNDAIDNVHQDIPLRTY